MPNKYEREIEEILRNMERTEPKASFGQRVSARIRRKRGARRTVSMPQLGFTEWCLFIALVAALAAGGWAYAQEASVVTGTVALIAAACLLLVALSNFIARPHYSPSTRYNNNVSRLRYNPLRRLATSWRLLILKMRYRSQDRQDK